MIVCDDDHQNRNCRDFAKGGDRKAAPIKNHPKAKIIGASLSSGYVPGGLP
jgi:hypothetical protein